MMDLGPAAAAVTGGERRGERDKLDGCASGAGTGECWSLTLEVGMERAGAGAGGARRSTVEGWDASSEVDVLLQRQGPVVCWGQHVGVAPGHLGDLDKAILFTLLPQGRERQEKKIGRCVATHVLFSHVDAPL